MLQLFETPITGLETDWVEPSLEVLSRFYKAFNSRDLQLMAASWLPSDQSSMDNPIGGIRRGWPAILEAYTRIFSGKAEVYVEFYDFSVHHQGTMFFATGRERGYFKLENLSIDLAIRTTRIFVDVHGDWKQIHHHGSIENPELLKNYQSAVLNHG